MDHGELRRRLRPVHRLLAAAAAALLLPAPHAQAAIDGPCAASIAGFDAAGRPTGPRSEALVVQDDARVPVTMSADTPIDDLKVELVFGPFSWTVYHEPAAGFTWTKTLFVGDYARYGVGLYKVKATTTGVGLVCSGAVLVEVEGNPLTTVAGLGGLALVIAGLAGLAASAVANARAGGGAPRRLALSVAAGLLGAVGVGALLQEYAVLYPTTAVVGLVLAAGAAVGLVLPFLARAAGGRTR